jgi:hypothetical protein
MLTVLAQIKLSELNITNELAWFNGRLLQTMDTETPIRQNASLTSSSQTGVVSQLAVAYIRRLFAQAQSEESS